MPATERASIKTYRHQLNKHLYQFHGGFVARGVPVEILEAMHYDFHDRNYQMPAHQHVFIPGPDEGWTETEELSEHVILLPDDYPDCVLDIFLQQIEDNEG